MNAVGSDAAAYIDGPWKHVILDANGSAFHAVESGPADGPLMLFLHGFPEFWWTWRDQLRAASENGWHAVAVDLRGYGASDKPPRGYDLYTAVHDATGVISSLGYRDAVLVGSDLGGFIAWSAATLYPRRVRGVCSIGSAHPLQLRHALATNRRQAAASRYFLSFQLPRYEHRLTARNGRYIARLFEKWAAPAWRASADFPTHVLACRNVMLIQQAAFCAMEYYRWAIRSLTRREGWAFARDLSSPTPAPVLQIHGTLDTCILPQSSPDASEHTTAHAQRHQLDGVGHFPHREASEHVSQLLTVWAAAL